MMVLLKEAWTWAIPSVTTRLIFFLVLAAAGLAMVVYPLLLDGLARTLTGTCIGPGTLTTQREATTVTQAAIAAQVHQTLDRDTDFTTQVAFDDELRDLATQALDFRFRQIADLGRQR